MIQFVNAVETGNIQDASMLLPEIATTSQPMRTLTRIPLGGYQALLKLMHDTTASSAPPLPIDTPRARRPDWVEVVQHLLNRKPDAALRLARKRTERNLDYILGSAFDAFSLVRAELAARNAEAARHLIKLRHSRGNIHYMDDFFLARVEHLDDNTRLAAARFASVLSAVETYQARGRLDFELALACELSQGDIVHLTQLALRTSRKHVQLDKASKKLDGHPNQDASTALSTIDVKQGSLNAIIGRSEATRTMRETIRRFADLEASILITGETGTGKEVVARALHGASNRRTAPFIPVNCSAITETLLESELFGYERGAFTGAEKSTKGLFESAGKGVIFLDEIGDISPKLQMSLLRVLETGEIRGVGSTKPIMTSCRVIAATNADLEQRAESGQFRRDLLFRLQRLLLHIPPLRERTEDVPQLVRHFLDQGRKVGTHATLSREVTRAFRRYNWPGNVRELKNVVERMRMMHSDKLAYDIEDLDLKLQPPSSEPTRTAPPVLHTPDAPRAPDGTVAPPSQQSDRWRGPSGHAIPSTEPISEASVSSLLRGGRSPLRRLDRLRELFDTYGKLTRGEIIKVTNVSPNTATKDLKALCDEGYIDRVEPSASTRSHYFQKR